TMRKLKRPDVFLEVFDRIESRSCLKHHCTEATLSEHLRRGSTTCTRTDDADVIYLPAWTYLKHGTSVEHPGICFGLWEPFACGQTSKTIAGFPGNNTIYIPVRTRAVRISRRQSRRC